MRERVKLKIATEVPKEIVNQINLNKYNFVKNDKTDNTGLVGRGRQRIVYLVQEKKSLKLFVAKFKNPKCDYVIPDWKETEYVKSWSDLLNNPVELIIEGGVLLQTYIEGLTLQQWLVTDPIKQLKDPTWTSNGDVKTGLLFQDSEKSLYVKEKLILFYCRMILNCMYVADLNNENIIFSEKYDDWIIVDGKQIFTKSFRQTLRHFRTRHPKKMKYKIKNFKLKLKIKKLIWDIKERTIRMKKNNYKFNEN